MSNFVDTENFQHDLPECTGILLTNLGTPDAPTTSAVRTYLAEFLSDPRIVELPRWLWWLILHGIILRVRPRRVAKAYCSVWTEQGAPLLAISRQQTQALQTQLNQQLAAPVHVELGMRYGNPSIASALHKLKAANARRILILPLYPQYSATTTASTFDALAKELTQWRWLPELRMIQHYHDHPAYIAALAASIRDYQQQHGSAEKLLFSFHGLPERYLYAGDPYFCECHKTARLVAQQLQLVEGQWAVSFQSRFGREEWLKPYTDKLLMEWGQQGVGSVQVCCPGFAADCLETLEEIAVENRDYFLHAGGKEFHYIPALNSSPTHIQLLTQLVQQHASDWLNSTVADLQQRQQLAQQVRPDMEL